VATNGVNGDKRKRKATSAVHADSGEGDVIDIGHNAVVTWSCDITDRTIQAISEWDTHASWLTPRARPSASSYL